MPFFFFLCQFYSCILATELHIHLSFHSVHSVFFPLRFHSTSHTSPIFFVCCHDSVSMETGVSWLLGLSSCGFACSSLCFLGNSIFICRSSSTWLIHEGLGLLINSIMFTWSAVMMVGKVSLVCRFVQQFYYRQTKTCVVLLLIITSLIAYCKHLSDSSAGSRFTTFLWLKLKQLPLNYRIKIIEQSLSKDHAVDIWRCYSC